MSRATQYAATLVGATDACTAREFTTAVVSPRTEVLTLLDPTTGLALSPTLGMPGVSPSAICKIPEVDQVAVVGRRGTVALVSVATNQLTEVGRIELPARTTGAWIAAGRGLAETGRRRSHDARRLIETVAAGTPDVRLVDVRSDTLVFVPVSSGIAVLRADTADLVLLTTVAGVTPLCEAGAFDADTGRLYVVDSAGLGCCLEVTPNNALVVIAKFTFPHIQGPVSARVIDSVLYITNERANALRAVYLADPENAIVLPSVVPSQPLYWERSLVTGQESGGIVTRQFGDWRHGHPVDLPITRSDRTIRGDGDVWQWAIHGPLGKITFGPQNMTTTIHLLTAEVLVKARGVVDDDLRVRLGATTLSDTRFNLGWYKHDVQKFFPGTPPSGALIVPPLFFAADHWRWVRIDAATLAANQVVDGDRIDVDLSNGWTGGYLTDGWDIEVVFTGGGTAAADPALGTASAIPGGSVVNRPFATFTEVAPVYDYYHAGYQFVPGPVVRVGGTSTFISRVVSAAPGPYTYSFWVGAQYGPPAQRGTSNSFTTTVPADAEGAFVVSVLVTAPDGTSASAILTATVQEV